MPEYLSPGVYVEEIEIGGKPIEGVSTSTAGFLGETERGPTEPHLVTSFEDFRRQYGDFAWTTDHGDSESYLAYGVEGFFLNGGKRCFVARITGDKGTAATTALGLNDVQFTATAVGEGSWGKRIGIALRLASRAKPKSDGGEKGTDKLFRLDVYYWSEEVPKQGNNVIDPDDPKAPRPQPKVLREIFDNLSWDPKSPDYYLKRVTNGSNLINLEEAEEPAATATTGATGTPATTGSGTTGTTSRKASKTTSLNQIQLLQGGADGTAAALKDYQGEGKPGEKSGLAAFEEVDEISIICAPDEPQVDGLTGALVAHCEKMKDRFAILQAQQDTSDIGKLYPSADSQYAAFYYPWIEIIDPVDNTHKRIPPGGHLAGIYARTDIERGVHKAPANEAVFGAVNLEYNLTTEAQDVLNPRGVNCIRSFVGRGIRVWGARTTSDDPLWHYVNVRRLFIFLEKSIQRSTQWVVFEPNNEALWARLKQGVSDWLTGVWRDGALMGTTAEQAFFVKCDRTTMTENDIETGKLIMVIGVAPTRPAEFVIFRLAQWRSGSAITE
jgi:hypothetical protein